MTKRVLLLIVANLMLFWTSYAMSDKTDKMALRTIDLIINVSSEMNYSANVIWPHFIGHNRENWHNEKDAQTKIRYDTVKGEPGKVGEVWREVLVGEGGQDIQPPYSTMVVKLVPERMMVLKFIPDENFEGDFLGLSGVEALSGHDLITLDEIDGKTIVTINILVEIKFRTAMSDEQFDEISKKLVNDVTESIKKVYQVNLKQYLAKM